MAAIEFHGLLPLSKLKEALEKYVIQMELLGRGIENRVLKIIFRPKREEVTEGWRKLRCFVIYTFVPVFPG
jgi:hypothetical protein